MLQGAWWSEQLQSVTPWQLVVGVGVLLLTWRLFKRSSGDLHLIPGPRGLPLLGNVLEFAGPRAHQQMVAWAKQYGYIYKFRLANFNCVVLTDPQEFASLVGRSNELPKAFDLVYDASRDMFSPSGRDSFFITRNKPYWAAVRKGCLPFFSVESVRKCFPVIRDTIAEVCGALERKASGGDPVDCADAALRVALDVFSRAAFGLDFNARSCGRCLPLEALPPMLSEFSQRMVNPLRMLKHVLLPWSSEVAEYKRNLQVAYDIWAQLARQVKATDVAAAEAEGDVSLRVCLARIRDPATGELLSEENILPHAAAFFVAGFETTAHSVSWTLYEIARHPEVQAKLAAELAAAGLLWADCKPGRELEYGDLALLPFLNMVWKEGLRIHPVAAFSPIRTADREVVLQSGLRLPKGTNIWIPPCAVHAVESNWVDPGRFWPERWEDHEGKELGSGDSKVETPEALKQEDSADAMVQNSEEGGSTRAGRPTPCGNSAALARSFMAFSYGPHDCVGQVLANCEGRAMLAMLCSRFEFAVAPRMGTPEDVWAAEVNRLTMQSGKGMWLLLRPRAGV